jgi:hypothetical protein
MMGGWVGGKTLAKVSSRFGCVDASFSVEPQSKKKQ